MKWRGDKGEMRGRWCTKRGKKGVGDDWEGDKWQVAAGRDAESE